MDIQIIYLLKYERIRAMVLNTTFNNILVISWRSVLLVEETGETHRPVASDWQIYHIILYRVHLALNWFQLTTLVVIGTDCICTYRINHDGPCHYGYLNNNFIKVWKVPNCYKLTISLVKVGLWYLPPFVTIFHP